MESDDIRAKVLKRQLKEDNDLFAQQSVSILGCGGLGSVSYTHLTLPTICSV